jgi:phosphatidate cytidylyltransferase
MLLQRLLSAAVGIPLIILTIWIGHELFAGVVALAVFIASIEISAARGSAWTPWGVLTALLTAALPAAATGGTDDLLGGVTVIIIVLSMVYTFTQDPAANIQAWLWGLTMALYFGVLAGHFVLLRELHDGRNLVIFAVLTVWTSDTGAYAIGRTFGKRKLAPAISPGKTVEGAIGGIVTGFVAVFVFDFALSLDLELKHRIALGILLPIVIMFGDLAESAIKRSLGVKDSSVLVPGHGGIADRLDSLLFAIPAVYWYVQWIIL